MRGVRDLGGWWGGVAAFRRWGHARWSMWRRSEVSAARRTRGHTVEDRIGRRRKKVSTQLFGAGARASGEVEQVEQSPERLLCVKFV